jgi:hypothetical protein
MHFLQTSRPIHCMQINVMMIYPFKCPDKCIVENTSLVDICNIPYTDQDNVFRSFVFYVILNGWILYG